LRKPPPAGWDNGIVTRARELEERLHRLEHQLAVYQRISRLMVRELSLADTLHAIVKLVQEFTGCDACFIYLIDGDDLVLCASLRPHPAHIGKVRMRAGEGLTGWVARERKLLAISAEAYKDPRFKSISDLPEDSYEAFLSAPVIARNRVVGVINVQHRLPHRHTGAEMELLTTVGEQVGCLLLVARMPAGLIEQANHVELVCSQGHIARPDEALTETAGG
jgi:uroporphyrinogen-III synthase